MRLLRHTAMLAIVAALGGCAPVNVNPFTAPPQAKAMSDDEKSVWEASKEQDATFHNMGAEYDDPALQQYLQGVMDKLYPEFRGTIHVHIMKSTVPNAFMMANGSCYVQIGILPLLHDEAQIAIVLGHEGIHFTNRHGFEEHRQATNSVVTGVLFGAVIPILPLAMAYSSIAGYSVSMESQADAEGYKRFVNAGYSSADAFAPFQALDQYSQALEIKEDYFFADHPKLQARITYFKKQAAHAPAGGVTGKEEYLKATEAARLWLLQELTARQDYKPMLFYLEDPAKLAEFPPEGSYYLGRAYAMRGKDGDPAKADDQYRQAIQKAPAFAPSYAALGESLMRKGGQEAEALSLLRTYLQLAPDATDRAYVESYIKRLSAGTSNQSNSKGN